MPGNRDKLDPGLPQPRQERRRGDRAKAASQGRIVLRTAFRPGVRLSVPGTGARVSLPLMIEIEDNGPGVPEQLKPHLFDPFVTTKRTGTGLGLALVAKIIGDHGGVIECEVEPKRTVFRVLLPLQDKQRARSKQEGRGSIMAGGTDPDRRRRQRDPHRAQPGASRAPATRRAPPATPPRCGAGWRRARATSSSPTS